MCECGCGEPTTVAARTSASKGWKKGEPLRFRLGHANRTKRRPPLDRTDYRVEDRCYATPCWIWTGTTSSDGYGKVTIAGRKLYAHRAMYEQEVGTIPLRHDIDHLCGQPSCVRPDHLEAVVHAVNIRRGRGAKLTDEQVEAIRADPRPSPAVAADYGIDPSYAWRVKVGKNRAAGLTAKNLDP